MLMYHDKTLPVPTHKAHDQDETIGNFVAAKPYITVPLDCPVDTVLTIMSHSGKRVAGVIDDHGMLMGFLTRSDLFGRLVISPGFDVGLGINADHIKALSASDVMTLNPAFLPSELSLEDAITLMTAHGYHYMPVLGDDARLMGIADLTELTVAQAQKDAAFDEEENLSIHLMRHDTHGVPYGIAAGSMAAGGAGYAA